MPDLTIKADDAEKLAQQLEEKAADFVSELTSHAKRSLEKDRRQQHVRARFIHGIKRPKTGARRFAPPKPAQPKAEPIPESFAAHFKDFFK